MPAMLSLSPLTNLEHEMVKVLAAAEGLGVGALVHLHIEGEGDALLRRVCVDTRGIHPVGREVAAAIAGRRHCHWKVVFEWGAGCRQRSLALDADRVPLPSCYLSYGGQQAGQSLMQRRWRFAANTYHHELGQTPIKQL